MRSSILKRNHPVPRFILCFFTTNNSTENNFWSNWTTARRISITLIRSSWNQWNQNRNDEKQSKHIFLMTIAVDSNAYLFRQWRNISPSFPMSFVTIWIGNETFILSSQVNLFSYTTNDLQSHHSLFFYYENNKMSIQFCSPWFSLCFLVELNSNIVDLFTRCCGFVTSLIWFLCRGTFSSYKEIRQTYND